MLMFLLVIFPCIATCCVSIHLVHVLMSYGRLYVLYNNNNNNKVSVA